MPAVGGLEKEFVGRVRARNLDATEPEARGAIAEAGFQSHGLLIRSPEGKILWTQADHEVRIEEVRAALVKLLQESSSESPR